METRTRGEGTRCENGASRWDAVQGVDSRIDAADNLEIRDLTELKTKAKVLVRNVYFEGGDVLRCYEGRFRFVLDDEKTIEIGSGEVACIYPEHRVTIEALARTNRLVYCVLNGRGVADYLSRLGYYDGMKGTCGSQYESVEEVMRLLREGVYGTSAGRRKCIQYLTDILVTTARDVRRTGCPLVIDAIRQIRENLKNRIVRLDPLCEQLKVSHAYLHRMFVRVGVGSPSEFVRQEQLRLAVNLLRETSMPICDVAEEAGFISTTHFANFIKRYTGKTARELRYGW